jgi:hypothetical protein
MRVKAAAVLLERRYFCDRSFCHNSRAFDGETV